MAYTNEQLGKALEDLTVAYNNFIEKAKEAAIVAMGDTVIAQIKQDAKNFIAAELAEQKTALEQAIEQAKIALKNSSNEAHVKLQQFSGEKQQELSALISNAETALSEMLKTAKIDYQDMADVENLKLTETAKGAKTAIEQSVNTANENLNKKGEEIIVKVKQEMTEHLDKLGASIEKKIEAEGEKILDSFKDGLNKITIATNKINESIKDFLNEFSYINMYDFLIVKPQSADNLNYVEIKIKSLRGHYIENIFNKIVFIDNTFYKLSEINKSNNEKDFFIKGKSIEYLYIYFAQRDKYAYFEINNFKYLKKIYWDGDLGSKKIKDFFKIKDCPAFTGFEKMNKTNMETD